jgi:hypothetical protein
MLEEMCSYDSDMPGEDPMDRADALVEEVRAFLAVNDRCVERRALIRVLCLQDEGVWLIVPGWNPHVAILRPTSDFSELGDLLTIPDYRFHARVNKDAEHEKELEIKPPFELDPGADNR